MKTLKEIGLEIPGHSKCENLELEDYLPVYDQLWSSIRNEPVKMLEIGIGKKGSLRIWKEYFQNGDIYGADIDADKLFQEDRITTLITDQNNATSLQELAQLGPFDIIIDDGGHQMFQQVNCLITMFDAVKPGGYYVVEDICTSYWGSFRGSFPPQGLNTLTFLSELIHEVNKIFIGYTNWGSPPNSRQVPEFPVKNIESISFHQGVVILRKKA